MKFYLMFIVFLLSSLHIYEVKGIRLGRLALSASNDQEIIKISLIKGSNQDNEILTKTEELPSGIIRKLMTKNTFSTTSTTISKRHKNDGNNHNNQKPESESTHRPVRNTNSFMFKLLSENSEHEEKIASEPYPNDTDIVEMDYTPARKRSPIHN